LRWINIANILWVEAVVNFMKEKRLPLLEGKTFESITEKAEKLNRKW
jgi:hypothetical protein